MPRTDICGRCGARIGTKNRRSDYNSLCTDCLVPHQDLMASLDGDAFVRTAEGEKRWTCTYCKAAGSMATLDPVDCTHTYEPCPSCHQHPYCAPDCELIASILSREDIYLAGFVPT